jgi:hypothetical protein
MKMVIVMIITLFVTKGYAQGKRYLTKEEVLKYWSLPRQEGPVDSIVVSFDSALNLSVIKFIDSLQLNKIDSVIIFSTSWPGYVSASRCDTGLYPITTFIIWNKSGETFIKKFTGSCSLDVTMGTSLKLFSFYANSKTELRSEFFMPVIFDACLNSDKTLSYTMSTVSHEPDYFFFYKIGTDCRSFKFSESYLENKQSMFYDHNLSLKAYAWWKEVGKVVNQLD